MAASGGATRNNSSRGAAAVGGAVLKRTTATKANRVISRLRLGVHLDRAHVAQEPRERLLGYAGDWLQARAGGVRQFGQRLPRRPELSLWCSRPRQRVGQRREHRRRATDWLRDRLRRVTQRLPELREFVADADDRSRLGGHVHGVRGLRRDELLACRRLGEPADEQ